MALVAGTTGPMRYVVASRSVYVYSSQATFCVAFVDGSNVMRDCYKPCYGTTTYGYTNSGISGVGVRPIIVLPSDIQVKEVSAGVFDIK